MASQWTLIANNTNTNIITKQATFNQRYLNGWGQINKWPLNSVQIAGEV
jgi:hypothetical protein